MRTLGRWCQALRVPARIQSLLLGVRHACWVRQAPKSCSRKDERSLLGKLILRKGELRPRAWSKDVGLKDEGRGASKTALLCHWFPSTIPEAVCLRPRTRCLHKHKLKFEELFISHLHGFLQAAESAAIDTADVTNTLDSNRGRREGVSTCGCQRHMRCPGGAQRTWEGIYYQVASGKLGVKLPGKSMWQRPKCESSGGLRGRGLARRLAEHPLCPGPALVRRGLGFFPPCHSHHCPGLYSLLLPHTQRAPVPARSHSIGTQICVFLPSGVPKNQVGVPSWRQKGCHSGNFLLKHSKKQTALQSTGIPLGWKFKMH